jgi:hypothetical protein
MAHNEKVLWLVGDSRHFCWNVRPFEKLIITNVWQFPSAETNAQKNYQSSITSVRPHLPQYYVGGFRFCPSDDVSMSKKAVG